MRASSDMVAGSSPSDFWWQWPCTRIRFGARAPAAGPASPRIHRTAAQACGYARAFFCCSPRKQRRSVVFERPKDNSARRTGSSLRGGDREERFHHLRDLLAGFRQQALRNQRASAAAGADHVDLAAAFLQNRQSRDANFRIVVIQERIVKQRDLRARRPRRRIGGEPVRKGLPLPGGKRRRRSMPSSFSITQRTGRPWPQPVGERREPAAPDRKPVDVAQRARPQRRPVALPVVRQELALEARHVHADGHSALQARHCRHRSSTPYTPSSPRPASPSCPVMARRNTLARPRVVCASSRVAM